MNITAKLSQPMQWLRKGLIVNLIALVIVLFSISGTVSARSIKALNQQVERLSTINAPDDPNWYGFASGNDTRSNLVFDGNYVWSGSGGGAIRWNKTNGDYRMFLPSDGLITYAVDSIVKDRNGSLWFGTYAGISQYNGHDWKNYNCGEIGFCSVWRSAMDASGNLWFGGYQSGLSKFDGTKWTRYISDESGVKTTKNINALVSDSIGNIWALASLNSVYEIHKFNGTSWSTIIKEDIPNCLDRILMINVAPNNDLWVSCGTSLARFHNGTWTSFGSDKGVTFYPVSLAFSQDGTVYAGGSGVYRLAGTGNFEPVFTDVEIGGYNNSLAVDSDGRIWAGTRRGMAKWDGSTTSFLTSQDLSDNYLGGMAVDKSGNFWAAGGSGQNGINKFNGSTWTTHCPYGGIGQNCAGGFGVSADISGNVWVAGTGLAKYDGTSWIVFNTPDADGLNFLAVYAENESSIWAATSQKLFNFNGVSAWNAYPLPDSSYHNWQDIALQGSNIWLSDYSSGLYEWNGSGWTIYSTSNGLPSNIVGGIEATATDVWVATEGGVAKYDGSNWKVYTDADGLANKTIMDIAIAPDGSIWAGLGNWGGVARLNGSAWTSFYSNYLVNGKAKGLVFDTNGNLWINNENFGIRVFNPNGLVHSKTIPESGGEVRSIDGFANLEINPQVFNEPVIVTIQESGQSFRPAIGGSYEINILSAATNMAVQPNPGKTFTLTFQYNPSSLSDSTENTLALYWWNGSQWEKEPSSVLDKTNRTVTAHPNHLSRWIVATEMRYLFLPNVSKK